jgi:hypothetical protein
MWDEPETLGKRQVTRVRDLRRTSTWPGPSPGGNTAPSMDADTISRPSVRPEGNSR